MKDVANVTEMTASERILYEGENEFDDDQHDKESLGETTSTGGRSKHRSMDFSGSVFLIASNGHVLSLPIPSESPKDPLNWVRTRRVLVFVILLLFSSVAMFAVQTPGVMYTAFIASFTHEDMKPFTVDTLASCPTLALGISFFIWMPLSVGFGRRGSLVTASALMTCAALGAGFARGFHELLAAVCLLGIAAGASLSTALLQLIDFTFIHERPLALASYWAGGSLISLLLLSQLPNIMNIDAEWRLVFRATSIPSGILTLAIFLFVPETYFQRPPVAFDGRVLVQSGTEKIQIYDEWREVPSENATPVTMQTVDDSLPPRIDDLPVHTWRVSPLSIFTRRVCDARGALSCFIQIFLCVANPLVFWVTLLNAVNFGGMMSVGTGFPVVLSQPPYSLTPGTIGPLPASYFMLNNLMKKLTVRNKGLRHAEFYLPAFVLPIVTSAASVIVYGFAAARHWDLRYYHLAYGLNAFSFASGSIVNTIWVTESLPQWAAPGLAVVGGVSYIASWGITAALPAWEESWGVEAVNMGIGVLILLVGGLVIPLAFWGRSVRQLIDGRWGQYQAGALRPQTRPRDGEGM
ncbi:hypothetical protein N0V93_007881 [Gnomoniopsis smithogilvyi]|uniref:Major facilitator superfamily (MFS) profile domain-containing protein n=1 Tax=Gnomoniopsis smithogilvyi TaxID=1191159 RepID=A0A9W8YKZ4_9PEZI|nr:hypothetical protein N0V93_007881 [Gnomoniopsis smithogilvyi]